MNIVFLAAYAPVLNRHGGATRMFHNLRILSERHEVHLISFVDSDSERDELLDRRGACATVQCVRRIPDFGPHWLSIKPFLVREFDTPEMHRLLDRTLGSTRARVLQCEYLQMAQYWRPGVFTVLTEHEAVALNCWRAFELESQPGEKLRLFSRWMSTLRYEVSALRRFDRVVTMTAEDESYLRSYSGDARLRTIPIGIDPAANPPARVDEQSPLEVFFLGNFRHRPNVDAARFIVERIAPAFPRVRFTIAGDHLPADASGGANVVFPGYLPNPADVYRRPNMIVCAPLFSGSGQRVKLLEAFAAGVPVVTTSVGAAGFPVEHGKQALLAETAEDFIAALTRLFASRALREATGAAARTMIEEHYSWSHVSEALLELVSEAQIRG